MRLYEWEAKVLLKEQGIPVPEGARVSNPDEAAEAAERLGLPVAIKAQVPRGGRMKAGGVRFARSAAEVQEAAAAMLGRELLGFRVDEVLVERCAPEGPEWFLAVTYDGHLRAPVILASLEGGVDVEQAAVATPAGLVRVPVDMAWPFGAYKGREVAAALGLRGSDLNAFGDLTRRLYELFLRFDATVAEVNPLRRLPDGKLLALDAHIELEDEALGRHPELEQRYGIAPRPTTARPPTPFEQAAAEIDAMDHRGVAGRVVEFDGDLGLLIGGGGASLTAFDAILAHGGRPANYCEIGGNPSVRKIRALTRHILSKPGVRRLAVIMNVVSNTRVDLVARGVIAGILDLGLDPREVIAVFRIPGAWEDEGTKILRRYGIPFCDRSVSIDEAARLAVERSR